MKVLFICTSPNGNGNTATIMKEIGRRCGEKGAEATWRFTADMDIAGCRGCNSCRGTGVCAIDDDMKTIRDDIMSADVVVLGSPVYMGAETGQTKCLIDRMYCLFQPDASGRPGSLVPKGKLAITILTCGLKDGDKLYNYENTKFFKVFVNLLGFDMVLSQIVPGMTRSDEVLKNTYATRAIDDAVSFMFP